VWAINKKHYSNTSPPVVYKDLVILGNGVGDRLMYKNDPPGDVRAFNARTGKMAWSFHTIPQPGEFGNETWKNDSWSFTGHNQRVGADGARRAPRSRVPAGDYAEQ
jgi:quinoprotein glucose dehydrogenase